MDDIEQLLWAIPVWCLYPLITGDAFKKDSGYTGTRFVIGLVSVAILLNK